MSAPSIGPDGVRETLGVGGLTEREPEGVELVVVELAQMNSDDVNTGEVTVVSGEGGFFVISSI